MYLCQNLQCIHLTLIPDPILFCMIILPNLSNKVEDILNWQNRVIPKSTIMLGGSLLAKIILLISGVILPVHPIEIDKRILDLCKETT